jgi:mono/diheme cytochrome c family protein
MIHHARPLLLIVFCTYCFFNVQAQGKKFPSPAYADTIKNQIKSDANAIQSGKKIYAQFCVTCHGEKGKGDGIAAPGLPKAPADHTSSFVQSQTDGALFWIITMGNTPMPSYKTSLTATQRWQVIDYIRTLAKTSKK